MEEALIAYLLAYAGLSAVVAGRIYPVLRPQAAPLPAITLQRIIAAPEYSDEGEAGLFQTRMQCDCWGKTYAEARSASRQVMAALSGEQFTSGGIEFQGFFALDETDEVETGTGSAQIFRTRIDFQIWYRQEA